MLALMPNIFNSLFGVKDISDRFMCLTFSFFL